MPYYESVFIARQDISSAAVEGLSDRFAAVIDENGGKVTKKEYWGLRNLAYKIRKNRKGHYVLFNLDAPPEAVQEMERQMRIDEDVIRYLSIKVDELEEGPSVMMQTRSGREGRGGREERGRREPRRGGESGGREAKEAAAKTGSAGEAEGEGAGAGKEPEKAQSETKGDES